MTEKPEPLRFELFVFNALSGLSFGLVGPLLPEMIRVFDLSAAQVSVVPVAEYAGCTIGHLMLGLVIRIGQPLLPLTAFITAAASLMITLVPGFGWPLAVAFFLLGISLSSMISMTGLISSRSDPGHAAKNLTLLFTAFSFGIVLGPMLAGLMLRGGLSYRAPFYVLIAIAGTSGLAALLVRRPRLDLGRGLTLSLMAGALRQYPLLLLTATAVAFLYGATESVPNVWIPKFFQSDIPGSSGVFSQAVLSLFWVAMGVGRLLCTWLIRRGVKPRHLLTIFAALGVGALILTPLLGRAVLVAAGFVLTGLCLSGMYPMIMAMVDRLPIRFTSMYLVVASFNMSGGMLMNRIVGGVADLFGFRAGMLIGAIPLLLQLIVTLSFGRVLDVQPFDSSPSVGGRKD